VQEDGNSHRLEPPTQVALDVAPHGYAGLASDYASQLEQQHNHNCYLALVGAPEMASTGPACQLKGIAGPAAARGALGRQRFNQAAGAREWSYFSVVHRKESRQS